MLGKLKGIRGQLVERLNVHPVNRCILNNDLCKVHRFGVDDSSPKNVQICDRLLPSSLEAVDVGTIGKAEYWLRNVRTVVFNRHCQ